MKVNDSSKKNSQEKTKEKSKNDVSKGPKKVKSFIKININDPNDNNNFEFNDTELKIFESTNSKNELKKDELYTYEENKNVKKSNKTIKTNSIESENLNELYIPKIKINDSSYISDHSIHPENGKTPRTRVSFNFQINEYFEDNEEWVCELLDYRRNVPPSDGFRRGRGARSLLCCCCHGNQSGGRRKSKVKIRNNKKYLSVNSVIKQA